MTAENIKKTSHESPTMGSPPGLYIDKLWPFSAPPFSLLLLNYIYLRINVHPNDQK
jgi:hypothetical protein